MAEWTRIYQCLPNVKSITWDAGPDLPMIFTSNGKHTADKIHLVTQVLFNSFSSSCTLHLHPFSNTCVRAFKLHNRFFLNSASDSSLLDSTNLLFKTGHSFLLMKLVQQVNTHTFNTGRCTLLMKLVQHINTHTFKTGYSTLLMKLVPQINTHTHTHTQTHTYMSASEWMTVLQTIMNQNAWLSEHYLQACLPFLPWRPHERGKHSE